MSRRKRRRKKGPTPATPAQPAPYGSLAPPPTHVIEPALVAVPAQLDLSTSEEPGRSFTGARLPGSGDDEVTRDFDNLHTIWIAFLGIICLLGVALIEAWGFAEASWLDKRAVFCIKVLLTLFTEFGVALVIAWFMILTVEKITRKELLKQHLDRLKEIADRHRTNLQEIEGDVFKHLLRSILDETVVDEFLLSMIGSRFVRKRLELDYEFERPPVALRERGGHGFLRVKVTVQYELHLIAGEREKTSIEHYFESTICEDETFDRMESLIIAGCEVPGECPTNELLLRHKKSDGIRQGFEIPVVWLKYGVPARIEYSYQVLRRYSDCEAYVTTAPADGLKVRIAHIDDEVKGLSFSLDWNHRIGFDRNRDPMAAKNRCLFIDRAFLPNQGFVLFWYPEVVREAVRRRSAASAAEIIVRRPN